MKMLQSLSKAIELIRGAIAFFRLTANLDRLGEVFSISDRTDDPKALERVAQVVSRTPEGTRALEARRRLPAYDVQDLARRAPGTLGCEFGNHMIRNKLDPAAIPTLDASSKLEFVRAHLYETHDIWHAVTGFGTDVRGEVGLLSFYMAQIRGPLPPVLLAAGLLNAGIYAPWEANPRMRAMIAGWMAGVRAKPLFGVDWDLLWDVPLEQVRSDLGIDPRGVEPALKELEQIDREEVPLALTR